MIESTIYVGDLRAHIGSKRQTHIEVPGEKFSSALCKVIDDVSCDLILESISSGLVIHGSLQLNFSAQCSYGLVDIVEPLTVNVNELFQEIRPRERIDDDDEIYRFQGDDLDIEQMLCDSILTSLPLAPVCGHGPQDCSVCSNQITPFIAKDLFEVTENIIGGIDDVVAQPKDDRWAQLDQLKLDDD